MKFLYVRHCFKSLTHIFYFCVNLVQLYKLSTILQIRKLTHRKLRKFAQVYTINKEWSCERKPDCLKLNLRILFER